MSIKLGISNNKNKKFMVTFPDGIKIHFGARGYEDYTDHKDDERKENYIKRHEPREDWTDEKTPGYWARWLLWEKPTLEEAIENIEQKLKTEIII